MKDKKYKLDIQDVVELADGVKLTRIVALKDIITPALTVLAGDKGGYVESERNLSQKGNSWISKNSIVRDEAFVCGDAVVGDKSEIWGEAYVTDKATVKGAKLCDNAIVCGECTILNCNLAGSQHIGSSTFLENCTFGDQKAIETGSVYSEVFNNDAVMEK